MTLTPPDYYREHLLPAEELQARVTTFQAELKANDLDGALITHNTGLYYLAGTIQPSQLYVPVQGEPVLLVRRNEARARLETAWRTEALTSLRHLADRLASIGPVPETLGLELDVMPVLTMRRYQKALPDVTWQDVGGLLRVQRSVKTAWEIERLRMIQPHAREMLAAIPRLLEAGITEVEFAGRMEAFGRRRGHQGRTWLRGYTLDMYWGHILAGESGTVGSFFDSPNGGWGLHPAKPDGPGERRIERNMPVLVDYVAAWHGYNLDQTRTAVIGELAPELQEAYEATVAVQTEVVAAAGPGVTGSVLFELAQEAAGRAGIAEGLGGRGDNQARFVGHGIGLEIDELPLIAGGWKKPLQPGMVFALEPKYVHPTLGIVGIENSWLVTEEGVERLTPDGDELIRI